MHHLRCRIPRCRPAKGSLQDGLAQIQLEAKGGGAEPRYPRRLQRPHGQTRGTNEDDQRRDQGADRLLRGLHQELWHAEGSGEPRCVALYRYYHRDEDVHKNMEWIYVGKNRSHSKAITSIFFGSLPASHDPHHQFQLFLQRNQAALASAANPAYKNPHHQSNSAQQQNMHVPVLLSVGRDRMLHRYDILNSSIYAGLNIMFSAKIEQSAVPLSVWLDSPHSHHGPVVPPPPSPPPSDEYNAQFSSTATASSTSASSDPSSFPPTFIVIANSEYKFKLWCYDLSIHYNAVTVARAAQASAAAAARIAHAQAQAAASDENANNGNHGDYDDPHGTMNAASAAAAVTAAVAAVQLSPPELKCVRTALGPTYGSPVSGILRVPERKDDGSTSVATYGPSSFIAYSTGSKVVGLAKLPLDGNPNHSMGLVSHPNEVSSFVVSHDGRYLFTAGGADRSVNMWSVSLASFQAAVALSPSAFEAHVSLLDGGMQSPFYEEIVDYFYYCQLRQQDEATPNPRMITGQIGLKEAVSLFRALGFYPSQQNIQDVIHEVRFASGSESDELYISFEQFIQLYVNHRPVFQVSKEDVREAFHRLGVDGDGFMPRELLLTKLQTQGEHMSEKELLTCFQALLGDGPLLDHLPRAFTVDTFVNEVLGFEASS